MVCIHMYLLFFSKDMFLIFWKKYTTDDLDNFLTDVMDEETISEEEMDEEYHIFADEGKIQWYFLKTIPIKFCEICK
jgi:hypothetical protein